MGRSIPADSVPHETWARAELRRLGWAEEAIQGILVAFAEDVREFGPDQRGLSLLTAQGIYRQRHREGRHV